MINSNPECRDDNFSYPRLDPPTLFHLAQVFPPYKGSGVGMGGRKWKLFLKNQAMCILLCFRGLDNVFMYLTISVKDLVILLRI